MANELLFYYHLIFSVIISLDKIIIMLDVIFDNFGIIVFLVSS